jgi:carboxynorspermidine decarboxylase
MGGGYQYDEITSLDPLYRSVELLQNKYRLKVFIEPGEAIVGSAGYIVSSVVDLFISDGKPVAILDTSTNHMPQVFEYQYCPEVSNSTETGRYNYILAGATCLAGDIFGEYRFDAPLEIGSKVVFEFMGAYTLVKAHMFNGVSLPSIYAINNRNQLLLKKKYTFQDYISRWKDPAYETVRNRV